MKPHPPKWALLFLRWFCKPDYLEEIEGNLTELFEQQTIKSPVKAKLQFCWNVIRHLRWEYLRGFAFRSSFSRGMTFSYLKTAWRGLIKQRLYSTINIGGLALGLTCFITIFLYIRHELSFDRFHSNAENIYRVYQHNPGYAYLESEYYAFTPAALALTLRDEFPEVSSATITSETNGLFSVGDAFFYESGYWADNHFLRVFDFELLIGNEERALELESGIVLTRSLATKMFGDKDPIGEIVTYRNRWEFEVTAVVQDPPTNSSLQFSFLLSMLANGQFQRDMREDQWGNNDYYTFLEIENLDRASALQKQLPALVSTYVPPNPYFERVYHIQPLTELHLESNFNFDLGLKGSKQYLVLFSMIAIVVLLLACINYMNLAIARSIRRAKEVGLRKVIGAVRHQLVFQFIGESILISLLALLMALVLTHFLLPVFGLWLDRSITFNIFTDPYLIPGLLALVAIVGIISGSYPAFFMSKLIPAEVLKGKLVGSPKGFKIQKWLVTLQYATSIVLIIGSIVIYQQFQFIKGKDLGYEMDRVLVISVFDRELMKKADEFKNEVLTNSNVLSITTTAELPTNVTSGTTIRHLGQSKGEGFNIYRARVDYGYIDVFGIELLAGRDFSLDFTGEDENYIINESAAKELGWSPSEAVGNQIRAHEPKTVIGVVKDFHSHSMHMEIQPLLLMMSGGYFTYIAIKIKGEDMPETIASVEKVFKQYSPYPFDYKFLDQEFDQLYKADLKVGEMFAVFTTLAIVIASLGLFGLAAFTVGQRTKEIGIRKVLGASVSGIVSILARDFLKLVAFGFIVAIPLAIYTMNLWLQGFAYRINVEWWVVALGGLAAMVVAFLTVSLQTIKAAVVNPVISLKDE